MKRSTAIRIGMAVAGLAMLPAYAQQESAQPAPSQAMADARQVQATPSTYREPLTGNVAQAGERPLPEHRSPGVPTFPSGPTTMERVSSATLGFAAKSAFSLAANRTGTGHPVPAPSYAPYRPGMPMPEPGAEAIGCEPNGALTTPAICAGR